MWLISINQTFAQTFNWTNNGGALPGGDNVWTNPNNWELGATPNTASHIARFASGTGSALLVRDGSSGTINIGTIQIVRDDYTALKAGGAPVTINFGSSGAIDQFHVGNKEFYLGTTDDSAINVNTNGLLRLRSSFSQHLLSDAVIRGRIRGRS